MSTSLAEQLQRLAVPQTTVLKRDRKRASLLFNPKEAAGLKRETVYQIGLEGLEELISKNEVFDQFKNSLFHITSRDFERSVQDNESNSKLDKAIKKFLVLLSPYFLLNCSHKALEWLINRYSINEYNREGLLMLILPYHESNIFVRVLQLLHFKDSSDSFYFLKALQKPGVHLPKQSLLQHAASDSSFLKFVTKYIMLLLKFHEKPNLLTVAFNFYCSVFAGAVEYSEKITEDQVSQMLPLILKGLNSPIADFCAASYVVTARLVTKSSFSDKLLDKFVEKLSDINVLGLKTEMCLVLIVLYQSQKQYSNIPVTAVASLSEKEWLPKTLQELNNSGSYSLPFLKKLFRRCTEEGTNNNLTLARELIKNCLTHIKLDHSDVPIVLHSILDSVKSRKQYSDEITTWLIELIQMLEKQYPNAFDQEIIKILSAIKDERMLKRKKLLSKILKSTMAYKGKFDVFEKLNHPNPEIRGEAIEYLKQNYNSLRETNKEIIKQSLLDRLNDDDINIVRETLSVVLKISIFEKDELKSIIIDLAKKVYKEKSVWITLSSFIIKLLNTINDPKDWKVVLAIFPYLLPKTEGDLLFSKKIIASPCVSKNVLLKPCINKLQNIKKEDDFVATVFSSLQRNSSWDIVKEFLEVLHGVPKEQRDTFHKYVASLVLTNILPDKSPIDVMYLVLDILLIYYKTCDVKSVNKESNISHYIDLAAEEKFPIQGYLKCLECVIEKTDKQELNLTFTDFSEDCPTKKYFVVLANILINNKSKKTAALFLNYFCEDWATKFNFLLNLCISGNTNFNSNFKTDALNYLIKCSKTIEVEVFKQFIYIDRPTTAYLLTLLADPSEDIRKLSLEIIESLINASSRKSTSYFYLLESLRKHKEEIIIDHEQISLIIFNILDSSNTRGKKHSADLNSIRNHLIKLVGSEEIPIYLKASILNLLSHINSFEILEQVCSVAIEILQEKHEVIDRFKAVIIKKIINRIETKIASKLSASTNTWKFIVSAIKDCKTTLVEDEQEKTSPAVCLLWQLEKDFFQGLEDEIKKLLLDIIIEVSCVAENPEVLPAATRIFKHIDLDANLIMEQLTKMREVQSPKTNGTVKRRISVVPTVDILDTLEWRKGVGVLEFIQDKKKIRNTNILLPVLFDILKKCLDFDEQTAVEYPKQLLLSSILHCCLKLNDEVLPENVFNMELIVQCIRASQNPQTHHHALLVLAHTAQLLPSQVLHHMMAIFTFMGSSVLRHDDAYSFQIITKIIDTIIPILVQDNHISTIAKVLRVFVDILLDVPEHRRMPLYKQLLTRINVQENLYLFLLLIFESQVLHSNQEKQRSENSSKRLDITADLCREFTPSIVLSSCIKLIKHLIQLPDEKEDIMETDDSDTFNIITHSPKDFRHYKYLLLKFISNLLASQEFVRQIAILTDEQEVYLEDVYKEMIVNILQYIQRTSKVADKAANTPQAQYWKVILHHSYDVLDSLNALVTPQMFLLVTKGLMVHSLNTVRRRILELLNNKLQHNAQFFAEREKSEIYTLIPPIINIIEGIDNEVDTEQEIIIQTALLSLKLLIKSLAPDDPQKFVQILDFITNIINSGKAQNNVLASVILCLAELCVTLKAYAIAGLAEFMPGIIKTLKQQKYEEVPSVLMRSVITTIEKIFMSMPLFLSPYLEKLLVELSILISKWGSANDDQKLQPFLNKLSSIKQKIGTVIPPRVLIPAVEACYNKLIEKKCFSAISALMDILAENLSNLKGPEINSNLPELTSFFLNALKFRGEGSFSFEDANIVEGHIIQALTVLILKLSENTFRPLYYKLFDWAVRNDVKNERVITFYNLSSGIAHSLKGLFVLFAGHFLNNAAQILDSCNEAKNEELYFNEENKNILLLEYTLKTLNAVFLYGSQRFINKDRFDILMQPLVDQLENTLGGVENLVKRNEDLLTPCLIHFTLATGDDALWKQMNYQILLKMRHNVAKIRLVALHCLTEIVKKLGEDFLSLLPETIPFLAELLEDEEEEVEKACQRAVQEMEKVLGEPLQKYF